MSKLEAKSEGIRFEPVLKGGDRPRSKPPRDPRQPGWAFILFGVIYPLGVIAIELIYRLCASVIFDPIPTQWHVLAVGFVPIMNFLVWLRLAKAKPGEIGVLAFAMGAAILMASFYALLFLPILPLSMVAILFYGIGLLPLAPLVAFVASATVLRRILTTRAIPRVGRHCLAGAAAGLVALIAIDIPMVATRLGVEWAADTDTTRRERGLTLLRTLGDDDMLLRLCYGTIERPSGPLGMLLMLGQSPFWHGPDAPIVGQSTAREIYYRVHGSAFNSVRAPRPAGRQIFSDEFQADSDLGGANVGGRVKGLTLTQSRIDGSIAGDDAVAYLEWTFEFRNVAPVDREARVEIALPPGAVVSRSSLWVNGEEREAAYGGRNEVRAAYQKVAVQQRRDPLLVTTKGADRVLAQAFPVPRNGGTIKFKLGITAPLDLIDASTGRLILPAIFDRNFTIDGETAHDIWIESKQPLAASALAIAIADSAAGAHRATGHLTDANLTRQRVGITVSRRLDATLSVSRIGDGPSIRQEIKARTPEPATTAIVIDGSSQLDGKIDDILRALATIPAASKVGIIIAADPIVKLEPVAWEAAAMERAREVLQNHRFNGGQDNAPALAEALQMLEADPHANLLWVHGPQPQVFQGASARLEQAAARLSQLPVLTLYPVEAGPNAVLPDSPWGWSAHMLPHIGSIESDLTGYLRTALNGRGFAIERHEATSGTADAAAPKGSEHVVRLYIREHVLEMMSKATGTSQREDVRTAAVALAASHALVTPVSGAVVLETQQQYTESHLTPATPSSVPTVPEPHEWALIGIAGLAMLWMMGRRRECPTGRKA